MTQQALAFGQLSIAAVTRTKASSAVDYHALAAQLKKQHRLLSLRYHPDAAQRNGVDPAAAAERFVAMQTAYEVLSDPAKRMKYDIERRLQKRREWRRAWPTPPPQLRHTCSLADEGGAAAGAAATAAWPASEEQGVAPVPPVPVGAAADGGGGGGVPPDPSSAPSPRRRAKLAEEEARREAKRVREEELDAARKAKLEDWSYVLTLFVVAVCRRAEIIVGGSSISFCQTLHDMASPWAKWGCLIMSTVWLGMG